MSLPISVSEARLPDLHANRDRRAGGPCSDERQKCSYGRALSRLRVRGSLTTHGRSVRSAAAGAIHRPVDS